ncbi:MAG: class I SAM-dependent methyltransferase [Spirochaetia bacterium]|nr:class I SAM-dependent methyltransferase [Spirochaetia bacterium]
MENSNDDRKKHWEKIYTIKSNNEMSWFQENPKTSLQFLTINHVPLNAEIIDVGGGDSLFVDHALKMGYTNITILDISEAAIERAKKRLGEAGKNVTWIVSDITKFKPVKKYDFWHDRAVFHFLTRQVEINSYVKLVQENLSENSIFVIGTFSENGPDKCSGLPITRYNESKMTTLFSAGFDKIRCFEENHITPSNKVQAFLFCSFKKLAA